MTALIIHTRWAGVAQREEEREGEICVLAKDQTKMLMNFAILFFFQATIGIDFLSKTMYLEDRTVRELPPHLFLLPSSPLPSPPPSSLLTSLCTHTRLYNCCQATSANLSHTTEHTARDLEQ